ncbi:MORN repeat-containing protein 1 isoform X2 [Nematostella vectensis]|uniref:MORN repeat-containing protein 1 isoform X2 n=1 Tax=Nematostella vectensis TaxID=45351 RepID=UPI0013903B0F|nr:MORN repeat-containing protein 1 isoform X2 [Nematostella vectensis]
MEQRQKAWSWMFFIVIPLTNTGHGKLLMADGSFYEGQFMDGEIQGHGFRYWASSRNEYTGQFVKGELHGNGVMKYGDGSQYEGEWMNNRREGSGKLMEKDGSVYEGSFHEHKKHGEGKMIYINGDVYEGDWVKDLRQGHGIIKQEDGTLYAGQWWGDEFHGEGSMVHCSGMAYEGLWVSGRPEMEAVVLRIVGKPVAEVAQGRPFGFEVECCTANGDVIPEEGRLLQVTGWVRIIGRTKTPTDQDEHLPTPFGFEVEPYYLTDSLGDISADSMGPGTIGGPPSATPSRPLPVASPTPYDSSADIPRQTDSIQVPEITHDAASDSGSAAESNLDLPNRTAALSQASMMMNNNSEKGPLTTEEIAALMPPPPSTARTTGGKAVFENLYLPPLPPGVKSFTTLSQAVEPPRPEYERRGSLMRWKKAGSSINPNLLGKVNIPSSIGEGGSKRKKNKEDLVDIVEKVEAKEGKKGRKDKREEKEEKLCKPGDYVIVVQDITTPRFLDSRLAPAFFHVKLQPKKRAKSKMESRRN